MIGTHPTNWGQTPVADATGVRPRSVFYTLFCSERLDLGVRPRRPARPGSDPGDLFTHIPIRLFPSDYDSRVTPRPGPARGGGDVRVAWRRAVAWALASAMLIVASACHQYHPVREAVAGTAAIQIPAPAPADLSTNAPARNLADDERMGGHTLARHVGKTDAELADRLRREPHISAASTYTDRNIAERSVAAALAASRGKIEAWQRRSGRRPNLALRHVDRSGQIIGRSLSRGQRTPVSCDRGVVVLRWDEQRNRFYVLTSYPEADR
jgi:Bacterial CdiA-CT RNAse A domain